MAQPAKAPVAASDAVPVEQQRTLARAELAEMFAQQAAHALSMGDVPEPLYRQADALARLAIQLAPEQPRFHRIAADAALAIGDRDRALVSLKAIRVLSPDDELTQVQLIDLFAAKMERAEQKVQYLETVVAAQSLPNVVRSHAATLLYDVYAQRGEDAKADVALEASLKFNPENLSALRIAFQRLPADAPATAKVEKIAAMLRGNPTQTDALMSLGHLLADAGRHDKAQVFYTLALSIGASKGVSAEPADGLNLIASQWIAGDIAQASSTAGQLVQMYPADADLRLAQVLLARKLISQIPPTTKPVENDPGTAAQAQLTKIIDDARTNLVLHLATLSRVLANQGKDLTPEQMPQPGVPLPDIAGDVLLLNQPENADLRPTYTSAVADLAFFDVYAAQQQPTPSVIEALAALTGESSALTARIVGWSHLLAGRDADALVKFDAVAGEDALAGLGKALILEKTDKPAAVELAKKLLEQNRGGLIAAIVCERVKSLGVSMQIQPDADALVTATDVPAQAVSKFVNDSRSSYVITAVPAKVVHDYGEPVLADITVRNTGTQPVTIGAGGMIDPRVFIDGTVRGVDTKAMPQQQMVTLTGRIRLEPSRSFTQRVRVDGISITELFGSFPSVTVPVEFLLVSNGVPTERGTIPAAGGQTASVGRIIERRASNFADPAVRSELLRRATSGTAVQRLRLVDLFARVSNLLQQQGDNPAAVEVRQALDAALSDRQAADAVDEIRQFAKFTKAVRSPDIQARKLVIDELAKEAGGEGTGGEGSGGEGSGYKASTTSNMLACLAAATLEPADRKLAFESLAKSLPEGLAKDFATAAVEMAALSAPAGQ